MTRDDDEGRSPLGMSLQTQRRIVAVLVPTALVLLAVVAMRGRRSRQPPPQIEGVRTAALRVTCAGDGSRCSRKAALQVVVGNGGRFRHVFAVGLDDRYAVHWYAPRPPDVVSAVAPTGLEQPLPKPLPLAAVEPGKLRVYALFSDAPLSAQELEAAAAELKSQQRLPSTLETLPLPRNDVLQKSLLVDISP